METQEAVRVLHFPGADGDGLEGEWHKYSDPRPVIHPTCPFQGCTLGKCHHYSTQDFFSLYPAKTDAEAGTAWLLASPHIQTHPSPGHLSHSKCFCLVAKPLRKKYSLDTNSPEVCRSHCQSRKVFTWLTDTLGDGMLRAAS